MTTPEDDTDDVEQYDPLSALTMSELADGSRQLKASLIAAVTGRTQDYERALAVVLWLHARRADPQARLSPFMALTFTELTDQLGALAPAGEPDPTTPAPA